jgi:hypothetical protein
LKENYLFKQYNNYMLLAYFQLLIMESQFGGIIKKIC